MIVTALGEEDVPNEMEHEVHFYSFSDPHPSNVVPILHTWIAYKETPKGYWIVPDYQHYGDYVCLTFKKWIQKENSHSNRLFRKFAYLNKEDALYSYYRRKLAHIRYVSERYNQLKYIIRRLENMHGFFGATRPNLEVPIESTFIGNIEPLKRERPVKGFIDKKEFSIC